MGASSARGAGTRYGVALAAALGLAALACSVGGGAETTEPLIPPAEVPTNTPETEAGQTAPESGDGEDEGGGPGGAEPSEGCTPSSKFVEDVTIPDGTGIVPGETFTKTWRLENDGDCAWDSRYSLAQIGADMLRSAAPVPLPDTQPGETAEISVQVTLAADAPPGSEQTATFQMRDPEGQLFGATPFVLVRVAALQGTISGKVWSDFCSDGNPAVQGDELGGCVWDDVNGWQGDGILEESEPGLSGVVVSLTAGACPGSGPVRQATTDGGGFYVFVDLEPGTYCVRVDPLAPPNDGILIPGGFTYPDREGDGSVTVDVPPGRNLIDVSYGWDFQFD